MLVRKYKILPTWNRSRPGLFEELKTKSESKCVVELYRLCKKTVRKKSSEVSKRSDPKPLFREMKKKKNSSKKKKIRKKQEASHVHQENTITESAQRSA